MRRDREHSQEDSPCFPAKIENKCGKNLKSLSAKHKDSTSGMTSI